MHVYNVMLIFQLRTTGISNLMESILHKLYAASISIGMDGSMLVASSRERVLIWGTIFCLSSAISLILWLIWKKKPHGKLALVAFTSTLLIPVIIIPAVRNEYIHVTRTEITVESGKWYMPSKTVLSMTNIKNIREIDNKGLLPGNLIGDPDVSWHITRNDGDSVIMRLNEFFNAHRMVVAYYYIDRGFWLERLEDQNRPAM